MSFTFDAWTSEPGDPYLSITGHYIDAPEDKPQNWELKAEQLAFTPVEGNHSGANMANILFRTVERYSVEDKVLSSHLWLSLLYLSFSRSGGLLPTMPQTTTLLSVSWLSS